MPGNTKRPHLAVYADQNHFADVDMPSDRFIAIVREAFLDGAWTDEEIDAVRDDVQFLFGKAVGQFNWSGFRTPRSILSTRLEMLEDSLATAAEILSSTGHLKTKVDSDLLSFISKAASSASYPDFVTVANDIAECDGAIKGMLAKVRVAKKELDSLNGSGKPPLLWYEPIIEGTILLAKHLDVPLATAGDRKDNPYETLFTRLTMNLERFLPAEMQSDNLASCAKRIERSDAWKRTD